MLIVHTHIHARSLPCAVTVCVTCMHARRFFKIILLGWFYVQHLYIVSQCRSRVLHTNEVVIFNQQRRNVQMRHSLLRFTSGKLCTAFVVAAIRKMVITCDHKSSTEWENIAFIRHQISNGMRVTVAFSRSTVSWSFLRIFFCFVFWICLLVLALLALRMMSNLNHLCFMIWGSLLEDPSAHTRTHTRCV